MRIGAVAAAANVNEQTLRYYERAGLLQRPTRSPNGYRNYPEETVALVRFIKRAQEIGFSLDEARSLASLRIAPGRNRLEVRQLAADKLADIERKISDLTAIGDVLRQLVTSCCATDAPVCPILDALSTDSLPAVTPSQKGRPT
jgi:MerR family transcriptional regulator, mercuric resistance operon regulatory protein